MAEGGPMIGSWSAGRFGTKKVGCIFSVALVQGEGMEGMGFLVPKNLKRFCFYFSFTLIFSYHQSAGRASPSESHRGGSWKSLKRLPDSGVKDAVSFSFCISAPLLHGLGNAPCCQVQ